APAMSATYMLIAFAGVVVVGAVNVLIATCGQSVDRQNLDRVQRIDAVLASTTQRGRAGEIVLVNLHEASGIARHRDLDVHSLRHGGRAPRSRAHLPGYGRLVIDAKFPLDDFQRAALAVGFT